MESSTQVTPRDLPGPSASDLHSSTHADLAYQAVTVAAILLVLCSLWVF